MIIVTKLNKLNNILSDQILSRQSIRNNTKILNTKRIK